jgi:GxxExxY protein
MLVESKLTEKIIGCAISVHKALGPGFMEKFYEEALCTELERENIAFNRQVAISLAYRGKIIGRHRLDLLVNNTVVIELKAVKKLEKIHYAVTLSYLKASRVPVALLMNFNFPTLEIKRFANSIFRLNAETQNNGNAEEIIEFIRDEE